MKKNMYRAVVAFAALLFTGNLWALSDAECETLLKRAEDNTAFYETDFKGSYTVSRISLEKVRMLPKR